MFFFYRKGLIEFISFLSLFLTCKVLFTQLGRRRVRCLDSVAAFLRPHPYLLASENEWTGAKSEVRERTCQ